MDILDLLVVEYDDEPVEECGMDGAGDKVAEFLLFMLQPG